MTSVVTAESSPPSKSRCTTVTLSVDKPSCSDDECDATKLMAPFDCSCMQAVLVGSIGQPRYIGTVAKPER